MSQRRQRAVRKQRSVTAAQAPPAAARFTGLPPARALRLPLIVAVCLVAAGFLPSARGNAALFWSFCGAGGVLLAWSAALLAAARGRTLALDVVVRRQHYLQACAQSAILLYWGWYWREVYDSAHLIAAQLVFAYAFDMLLTWSRRDTYTLGFGPFPVIFSINLFLWFKPDWFYLQFVMVAIGFAVKELVRWNRDGRRVHIFNPSSFPLSLFAVVLFLTDTTHLTWGAEIATTQLYPPHIYLVIFLVSLPAQFLFGVASMTLSAVVTSYVLAVAYYAATGGYFFLVPSVPIAVFLGMHLLFNDPSTSPRTEFGRIIFGVLYGLSVVLLFALLDRTGAPTFYDKLLAVPVLNLLVQLIDRAARSDALRRLDPAALGRHLTPRRRHLAYMAVWALVFGVMQLQSGTRVALARGDALLSDGRLGEAVSMYRQAVEADPGNPDASNSLGYGLLTAGLAREAVAPLRRAMALQPDVAEAHNNLALALLQAGRSSEAVQPLRRAVELRPEYAEAHYNLAHALSATGQPDAAVQAFRAALRLDPDWPAALRDLALLLATHADAGVRDPADAVRLAARAVDLARERAADPEQRFAMNPRDDALLLDALAAAYAAAGRFDEAARTAGDAEALVVTSDPTLAARIRGQRDRYREGRFPFEVQ